LSIQSNASREFNKYLNAALNQLVKVELDIQNRYYIGRLAGFDIQSLTLVLDSAKDEKNNKFDKIFIRGNTWTTMVQMGEPFPIEKLLDRIRKIMTGEEITLSDDNKIYLLGGKIVVSDKGVEGKGPTKDRIQKLFDTFVGEQGSK
jgi:small nuclear ribonucleoprotein (snRNP)-like protein